MEKIIEIKDYEGKSNYGSVSGFEVVTTEQSIKLFIDNYQSCCEHWGYFWSNDDLADFIGAELRRRSALATIWAAVMGFASGIAVFSSRL